MNYINNNITNGYTDAKAQQVQTLIDETNQELSELDSNIEKFFEVRGEKELNQKIILIKEEIKKTKKLIKDLDK